METTTAVQERVGGGQEEREERLREVIRKLRDGEAVAPALGIGEATIRRFEQQAFSLYKQDQFDQSKSLCLGVLALNPKRSTMHLLMGDMTMREYRFREAVGYLEEAVRLVPEDWRARRRLGEALLKLGRVDAAIEELERVLSSERTEASQRDRERADVLIDHARRQRQI